jgi:hypothetical protein
VQRTPPASDRQNVIDLATSRDLAAVWFSLVGQNSDFYPSLFENDVFYSFAALFVVAIVAIILNVAAGSRGSIDRRICFFAGVILASPVVYFASPVVYFAMLEPLPRILFPGG